jgi:hypothetical protein
LGDVRFSCRGLQKGILMKQYLVALTILLVAAVVSAAPSQRHREWCRAAVASLPVFHEDVDAPGKQAELDAIAEAVALRSLGAPLPPQTWAALILTVWKHESNLSSRIIAGNCKPKERDAGRARGGGQNHRNSLNGADWDAANGNVAIQVKMTDEALRRAYWTCSRSGEELTAATLSAYAGQRCGAGWSGLAPRLSTWNRLLHVAAPKAEGSS